MDLNNDEQYKDFMLKYTKFSLENYIKKILPGTKFEEEFDGNGRKYLKTDSMFLNQTSKLPTFYLTTSESKNMNLFFCFDSNHRGGPYAFMGKYHNIESGFERLQQELNTSITCEEQINKITHELQLEECIAEFRFETALLFGKFETTEGNWDY